MICSRWAETIDRHLEPSYLSLLKVKGGAGRGWVGRWRGGGGVGIKGGRDVRSGLRFLPICCFAMNFLSQLSVHTFLMRMCSHRERHCSRSSFRLSPHLKGLSSRMIHEPPVIVNQNAKKSGTPKCYQAIKLDCNLVRLHCDCAAVPHGAMFPCAMPVWVTKC